jgi:branched-chain amino acid transport system permease protein
MTATGWPPSRVLALLPRWGWVLFPLALLWVLLGDNSYNQYVAGFVVIYGLSALGLDWLMGRAGVVSLGNGAIMAFGALTAAYLAQHSWASFWLVLVVVTVLGGVLGFLISLPALRLRGVYFALVTLALQVVVVFLGRRYAGSSADFVGGIPLPLPAFGSHEVGLGRPWLGLLTVVLLVVVVLLRNMYRGQPGRTWMAIREHELAARTIGVASRSAKTAAFVGSTSLIALSGAFLAYYTGRVSPDSFTLTFAISFVVMVIIGGLRSLSGVLLGATIVTVAPLALGRYVQTLPATGGGLTGWFRTNVFFINSGLFGLLVLVVLLYMPRGVVPTLVTWITSVGARLDRGGARRRAGAASTPDTDGAAPVAAARPALHVAVPATAPPLLVIEDLRLTYRNGAQALAGVDLTVAEGEIVGIVGRNGVGKSSLMRSITGFYRSEGTRVVGRVEFAGNELLGGSPVRSAQRGITLVPEREKIFGALTVSDHLRRVGNADAARAAMPNEWEMLERKWDSRAGLLSGGERQLLALAMAASLRPRLLLIDEMSLGLSPIAIDRVSAAILELQRNSDLTVIVVEQNVEVAHRLCQRVLLMEAGKLLGGFGEKPPVAGRTSSEGSRPDAVSGVSSGGSPSSLGGSGGADA